MHVLSVENGAPLTVLLTRHMQTSTLAVFTYGTGYISKAGSEQRHLAWLARRCSLSLRCSARRCACHSPLCSISRRSRGSESSTKCSQNKASDGRTTHRSLIWLPSKLTTLNKRTSFGFWAPENLVVARCWWASSPCIYELLGHGNQSRMHEHCVAYLDTTNWCPARRVRPY